MTGTTTGQTALPTATDSDDNDNYLTVSLVAALQTIANLFESATGHDHSGSGKGKPISTAGIASDVTLTSPVLTSPVINGAVTGTAGFGAGTSFSPSLSQAVTVTLSATSAFYIQLGKLIFVSITLTASSAGTATNAIVIGGMPFPSARQPSGSVVGTYKSGSNTHRIVSAWSSTTALAFWHVDGGAANLGAAITIASGDVISVSGWYEST